ncbi:hypothetical protein SDC9_06095 [bioreactor metagenome]|uniref:Uncharacterized protein n=1 Tax=bioreactor metagenome TaxID=1076179 RepID=A0A644T117_9ZZZZ|nr:hypothetical protein [Negativicutes bacterium]
MRVCQYALLIENAIQQEVMLRLDNQPTQLQPLLELVNTFEDMLINILNQVVNNTTLKADTYSELDAIQILLETKGKYKDTLSLNDDLTSDTMVAMYMNLSAISNLIEKSLQFYRQAANNSAYEHDKLYFNSLVELKKVLKRRIDSVLRIVYNALWSKIGFAPFVFGKE